MSWLDPPVNPYDPNDLDPEPETLPLDEIIRRAFKGMALGLRVCMPAVVTAVLGNQKVNVQPSFQFRYIDQDAAQNIPSLQNIPVSMPMGTDYSIKVPVAVGDTGYLVFSDRNLDPWTSGNGEIVDPQDDRAHNINDAIFVPGLVPFAQQTEDNTTDIVITNGEAVVRVKKTGRFILTNGTNELLDLLDQITGQVQELSQTLSTDTVNTIFGPMQLNAFETYAEIADTLETLKTKLETLKG